MKWTTEKPTEPGWYWVGMATDEGVVTGVGHVWEDNGALVVQIFEAKVLSVGSTIFQFWAGPIEYPEGEITTEFSKSHLSH